MLDSAMDHLQVTHGVNPQAFYESLGVINLGGVDQDFLHVKIVIGELIEFCTVG
jgi:hypothetical protein